MTALAANGNRKVKNFDSVVLRQGIIATSSVIYDGSLIQQTAAGFLLPVAAGTTATFAGMAVIKTPTGTGGLTGAADNSVLIDYWESGFDALFACAASVTVGLVRNADIYALDDNTVTALITGSPSVGILVELPSSTTAWVRVTAVKRTVGGA